MAEVHLVEIVEVEAKALNKDTSMSKDAIEETKNVITTRKKGVCKQIAGTTRNKRIIKRKLMKKVSCSWLVVILMKVQMICDL